jgi:hypothetical protein
MVRCENNMDLQAHVLYVLFALFIAGYLQGMDCCISPSWLQLAVLNYNFVSL